MKKILNSSHAVLRLEFNIINRFVLKGHDMMIGFSLLVAFVLVQVILGLIQPDLTNLKMTITTDFDTKKFKEEKLSNRLAWTHVTGFYNSTGRAYSAYFATFHPSFFSFLPPTVNGCTTNAYTTVTSTQSWADCEYATNGGFFLSTPDANGSLCKGNLISNAHVFQLPTDGTGTNRAELGVTADGEIFTGFLDSNVIKANNFTQLITGWGWLVRNSTSNVQNSQDLSFEPGGFTYEKAPRTSVGHMSDGQMCLLEIDGEEDILAGPDLFEVAELAVSLGVESLINIDGGGSSVSVLNGKYIDAPTCKDTPVICERAVVSITCVRNKL